MADNMNDYDIDITDKVVELIKNHNAPHYFTVTAMNEIDVKAAKEAEKFLNAAFHSNRDGILDHTIRKICKEVLRVYMEKCNIV